MATILAVVMCRGCKVQVFDDGTILRIDEPIAVQQEPLGLTVVREERRPSVAIGPMVVAMQTWRDMRQNGPLVGWDPLP